MCLLPLQARSKMSTHHRYECKEGEPGKFTLIFRTFESAIAFGSTVHTALLWTDWSEDVLSLRGCAEELSPTGRTLFRGLRVKVGIAFGQAASRKPLSSGRAGAALRHASSMGFGCKRSCCVQMTCCADYYGSLPNLAARIMSVASLGQTLFEATKELGVAWNLDQARLALLHASRDDVLLRILGRCSLRGVQQLVLLAEAVPSELEERQFSLACAQDHPRTAIQESSTIRSLSRSVLGDRPDLDIPERSVSFAPAAASRFHALISERRASMIAAPSPLASRRASMSVTKSPRASSTAPSRASPHASRQGSTPTTPMPPTTPPPPMSAAPFSLASRPEVSVAVAGCEGSKSPESELPLPRSSGVSRLRD
jgi:hypothetical protein